MFRGLSPGTIAPEGKVLLAAEAAVDDVVQVDSFEAKECEGLK